MISLRLTLIACLLISSPAISVATTLNFSLIAQESAFVSNIPPANNCLQFTTGPEYPLSCEVEGVGTEASSAIGGTTLNTNTISSTFSFQGILRADVFAQPPTYPRSASAGYLFQAVISPLTPGDMFRFRLTETDTCRNTIGSCESQTAAVYGATSIKGNLKRGEVITGTNPVVIDLSVNDDVSNVVPLWAKLATTDLEITPIREFKPRSHLLSAAADVDTAPEPATVGLVGLTLTGLAIIARRTAIRKSTRT